MPWSIVGSAGRRAGSGMRVLILSNVFPPGFIGGYELGAYDVALGLRGLGHEVRVLTSDYFQDDHAVLELAVERSLRCNSLSHTSLPASDLSRVYYDFANVRVLGSALRRYRPDLVLAFNLHGLGVVAIIRYLQAVGIPLVLYLMDNVFRTLEVQSQLNGLHRQLLGAFELGDATHVILMSRNLEKEVCGTLGRSLRNVSFVPGWVVAPKDSPGRAQEPGGEIARFVFCSRVEPHKGTEVLLDAAEQVMRRSVRFVIDVYGAGQTAAFVHGVQARGLGKHVFYRGVLGKDEVVARLADYDALLFPTWEREPFGFIAVEAAWAGCLPILTGGIGAAEWFIDGVDALKIARNGESLARAMVAVAGWSAQARAERKSRLRRSARRLFPFESWLPKIERVCVHAARPSAAGPAAGMEARCRSAEAALMFLYDLLEERLASA